MPSWKNDMSVDMVVAPKIHQRSYRHDVTPQVVPLQKVTPQFQWPLMQIEEG